MLTAVLHYCGDSELTNGKTIVKNSKLTNGIAFFPQQMQSHKTLANSLNQNSAKRKLVKEFVSVYINAIEMFKTIYQKLFCSRNLYFVENKPEYRYEFDLMLLLANLVLLIVVPVMLLASIVLGKHLLEILSQSM